MFVVLTTVKVSEGSIDELAGLFDATNRELVAGHDDWLGAWFTANRATSEVTVIAQWRNASSYETLRDSEEFQATMAHTSLWKGASTAGVTEWVGSWLVGLGCGV